MILYWDIDNTLTSRTVESRWNPDSPPEDWLNAHGKDWIAPPDPSRLAALRQRFREGHEIVIWTCRTNPVVMGFRDSPETESLLRKKLEEWLDFYAIPFHRIEATPKPFFTYLIDDRAINPAVDADLLLLRYSRLKRYVTHDYECAANDMMEVWQEDERCTCGLSALLNEDWELGLKGSVRDGRQDT